MARGENVYALSRPVDDAAGVEPDATTGRSAFVPPALPAPLAGSGPFVGRADELQRLVEPAGMRRRAASPGAVFIGGEPGVGKSRLAAELAAHGPRRRRGRAPRPLRRGPRRRPPPVRRGAPPARSGAGGRPHGVGAGRRRARPGAARAHRGAARPGPGGPGRSRHRAAGAVRRVRQRAAGGVGGVAGAAGPRRPALGRQDHPVAAPPRPAGDRRAPGSWSSAPTATRSWPAPTRWPRRWPTSAGTAPPRGSPSAGWHPSDVDAYLEAIGIDDRGPRARARRDHLGKPLLPDRGGAARRGGRRYLVDRRPPRRRAGGDRAGGCPAWATRPTGRCRSPRSSAPASTSRSSSRSTATTSLDEIAEACHAGLVVEEPGTAGRFRFAHAHRPAGAAGRARHGQAGPAAPPDRRAPRRRAHRRGPRRPPRRPRLPLVGVRVARRRRQGRRRLPAGGRAGHGPPRVRGGRRPLRHGPPGPRCQRRRRRRGAGRATPGPLRRAPRRRRRGPRPRGDRRPRGGGCPARSAWPPGTAPTRASSPCSPNRTG